MAEVTRRRTGELLRKLFELLIAHPDGLQARDAIAALEKALPPTAYENGQYESGGRRYEYIIRFSTVDCVKAGWLSKHKGRWTLTEAGKAAYAEYKEPEAFHRRASALYNQWRASQADAEPDPAQGLEDETSGKAASITFEGAEELAWRDIDQYLSGMNPYEFQELVASLLRAMDYHVSWVAPPGKDGGIDILASPDPLGTRPPRIKVQVKRQAQAVSVDGLRSFMALLGEGDVGLFVCVGGFTRDAADEARTQEKRKVTLIDLEKLVDLWIAHYSRLDDEARIRLPLKPIYFLAPRP